MAWTTPRTWVAGETVTAALMNTHVRDNLKAVGDPWVAYTPAWTSSGTAPALGNGTIAGGYVDRGNTVDFRLKMTLGSTSTVGTGTYRFSIPFATTLAAGSVIAGAASFEDVGTAFYPCMFRRASTDTTIELLYPVVAGAVVNSGVVGAATPVVPGNGDIYYAAGTYERT